MRLGSSKILGNLVIKYVTTYTFSLKDQRRAYQMMLICNIFVLLFLLIFFIKAYVVGTHLNGFVNAIQMGTHNLCFHKEVDKKYTGCNLKTTELLDCVLIGVCAVIRSNMIFIHLYNFSPIEFFVVVVFCSCCFFVVFFFIKNKK